MFFASMLSESEKTSCTFELVTNLELVTNTDITEAKDLESNKHYKYMIFYAQIIQILNTFGLKEPGLNFLEFLNS